MPWRAAVSTLLSLFLATVSSSFAYGVYLLYRGPRSVLVAPSVGAARARDGAVAAQLRVARELLQRQEVEQAIVTYRRALVMAPSLEGQLGLAEGELRAGREEIAAREFERALVLDPANPKALRRLAGLYAGRPQAWRQSEDRYKAYLAVAPDDAQAQLELARLLLWQRRPAEAVELLSRPAVERRMSPRDRRDYALALVKANRSAEAEPLLESLADGDDDVTLQIAGLRASRGEWDSALRLYRSVLDRRPDDPRANLGYGAGQLALENYREALGPLRKAVRGLPHDGEAALFYGRALRGAGNLKKAAGEFERALPRFDTDAAVNREYADLLAEKRDYGGAERQYRRVLSMGQRDDALLLGLAGALSANGKPREALPLLEGVYERRPSDRLAYELAKLYQRVGRSDRALQLLKKIEGPVRERR